MEPTQGVIQLPEGPTAGEASKGSTTALNWIEESLKAIYAAYRDAPVSDKAPTLDRSGYLGIYNAVHEYCRPSDGHRGAHLRGKDIYLALERQIAVHCQDLAALVFAATALEDELVPRTLIQSYLERWERLGQVAGLAGRLLRSLDRHFTKREIDEQRSSNRGVKVYEIEDLHKITWKQEILRLFEASHDLGNGDVHIKDAVQSLQKRVDDEATESEAEREILDQFARSLTFLGVRYSARSPHDFRPVAREQGFGQVPSGK